VTVQNAGGIEQGPAVAVVGLPAGLRLPPDGKQLAALARPSGPIGAWELRGRELVLCWRGLAAGQKVEVPIDLLCDLPGEYTGPPSRAYLYDDADAKDWVPPLHIRIDPRAE
jgi:hypothetical protein